MKKPPLLAFNYGRDTFSGHGGAVLGAIGLVGGTATVAGESRVGHHCVTFGPRWLLPRWVGVAAKAAVTGAQGRRVSRPEAEKSVAAGAGRAEGRRTLLRIDPVAALALVRLEGWLQDVGDLAGRAVGTVNPASPDSVQQRAKARVLTKFHSAHAVTKIAFGGFPGLADRADDSDRLVLAVLALRDQHRQAEVGVGLEWDRKSLMGSGLLAGACHAFSLLAP